MTPIKSVVLVLVCHVLCNPFIAIAGFEEALTAYNAKDYQKAINEARQASDAGDARANFLMGAMYQSGLGVPSNSMEAAIWYEKAAKGGVIRAFSKLAQLYMRGDGVTKNPEKALEYARQSANSGDPEGMFLVHTLLKVNYLNYLNADKKPNLSKYWQLASRPLAERKLDVEAQDALYHASEKGYPLGIFTLALAFGGTIGGGNLDRMLGLTAKIPKHTNVGLQNYEKIARYMKSLGQSLTSPQLFYDAQFSQTVAAMIKTCGVQKDKKGKKASPPKLTAISIAKPLSGATYLPTTVSGYEHSYLVTGEWEEDWTFKGCDKTANVRIKFTADGLGGAHFESNLSAKDIPESQTIHSPTSVGYVPLNQIQITDRFVTTEVTKDNLVQEIQKCVPQFESNSQELQDFPSTSLRTFGHLKNANYVLLQQTLAVCIQQSTNGFPIFAAEALYGTVNPVGAPPEVIDGWYREIALLIAKNGTAKIAYVFNNGAACIATYSVSNEKYYSYRLSYSAIYKEKGKWESEILDTKFSHPLLTSYSIRGYGSSNNHEKVNPLVHRFMAKKKAKKVPKKPAPTVSTNPL